MQTIKQTLLSSWNFMRLLRLAVGVLIGIQAFRTSDVFSGIIAIFFLFQAITNTGCCGSGGCAVPSKK
jgi:uncharacterized membrane protein HdeD (DUF308 family)